MVTGDPGDYSSEDEYVNQGTYPLHDAVFHGDLARLNKLICQGHDINVHNNEKETPVTIAAVRGNDEVLKLLLNYGGDPDLCCNGESSLLQIAKSEYVNCAHESCVEILLDGKADPNIGDETAWTPLHEACYRGRLTLVEMLIKAGASLDVQTDDGVTPLYTASQYGQVDCIRLLLSCGADTEINTNDDDSPLYIACQEGYSCCAKLLIEAGCDVNHCNDSDMTPLAVACQEDNCECIMLLLDNDVDFTDHLYKIGRSDKAPLHIAARGGTCLSLLLENDVDVNRVCDDKTPLFEAASHGNSYGCELLLAKGADPNCECTEYGILSYTPLMVAVRDDEVDVVEKLISGGADKNYGTFTTPLILAIKSNSFNSFNYLLKNCNVDVNCVDAGQNTALSTVCGMICLGHISMTHHYEELLNCCRNLLKSGADTSRLFQIDVYSHVKDLPLIHSHPKLMKLILEFDGERKETREICQLMSSHKDWKPLYDIVISPKTLEVLCRLVVRQSLRYTRLSLIDDLPLPGPLKNYLKHNTAP